MCADAQGWSASVAVVIYHGAAWRAGPSHLLRREESLSGKGMQKVRLELSVCWWREMAAIWLKGISLMSVPCWKLCVCVCVLLWFHLWNLLVLAWCRGESSALHFWFHLDNLLWWHFGSVEQTSWKAAEWLYSLQLFKWRRELAQLHTNSVCVYTRAVRRMRMIPLVRDTSSSESAVKWFWASPSSGRIWRDYVKGWNLHVICSNCFESRGNKVHHHP